MWLSQLPPPCVAEWIHDSAACELNSSDKGYGDYDIYFKFVEEQYNDAYFLGNGHEAHISYWGSDAGGPNDGHYKLIKSTGYGYNNLYITGGCSVSADEEIYASGSIVLTAGSSLIGHVYDAEDSDSGKAYNCPVEGYESIYAGTDTVLKGGSLTTRLLYGDAGATISTVGDAKLGSYAHSSGRADYLRYAPRPENVPIGFTDFVWGVVDKTLYEKWGISPTEDFQNQVFHTRDKVYVDEEHNVYSLVLKGATFKAKTLQAGGDVWLDAGATSTAESAVVDGKFRVNDASHFTTTGNLTVNGDTAISLRSTLRAATTEIHGNFLADAANVDVDQLYVKDGGDAIIRNGAKVITHSHELDEHSIGKTTFSGNLLVDGENTKYTSYGILTAAGKTTVSNGATLECRTNSYAEVFGIHFNGGLELDGGHLIFVNYGSLETEADITIGAGSTLEGVSGISCNNFTLKEALSLWDLSFKDNCLISAPEKTVTVTSEISGGANGTMTVSDNTTLKAGKGIAAKNLNITDSAKVEVQTVTNISNALVVDGASTTLTAYGEIQVNGEEAQGISITNAGMITAKENVSTTGTLAVSSVDSKLAAEKNVTANAVSVSDKGHLAVKGNVTVTEDKLELADVGIAEVDGNVLLKESGMTVAGGSHLTVTGSLTQETWHESGEHTPVDMTVSGSVVEVKDTLTNARGSLNLTNSTLNVTNGISLHGNLTATNGTLNALYLGGENRILGAMTVEGGQLNGGNIDARNGVTLTGVQSLNGGIGNVTVDNQDSADKLTANLGTLVEGFTPGNEESTANAVAAALDAWDRAGISITNSEIANVGTLSTTGKVSVSGGSLSGVAINADSEALIGTITDTIGKELLGVTLADHKLTAGVELKNTTVILSDKVHSNGELTVSGSLLAAKSMDSSSSQISAISITDGSTVVLEEGIKGSGTLEVSGSTLVTGGDVTIAAEESAHAVAEHLGIADYVTFSDCNDVNIGGKLSANGTTVIASTTLIAAKGIEVKSTFMASDINIANGSNVTAGDTMSSSGNIVVDGSTLTADNGIKTATPYLDKTANIRVVNGAKAAVNGAVDSAGTIEVNSGATLAAYDRKSVGETVAEASVSAKGNVEVAGGGKLTSEGNLSTESDLVILEQGTVTVNRNLSVDHNVIVSGEGSTLGVGGDVTVKDLLHVEDGAVVNFVGGSDYNLNKVEMSNGHINLLKWDDTVPTTAYDLELGCLLLDGAQNTMEANLILCGHAQLAFKEGALLTMGCDVTIGSGTDLILEGLVSETPVAMFADVEALTLGSGSTAATITENGWYDAYGTLATVNGFTVTQPGKYEIGYHDGVVSLRVHGAVPEPATATLSLLALAALAARRRRH